MKVFKSTKGKTAVHESYDKLLQQWDVEFEEADINGGFGTTHVIMAGSNDNPPLLLFHGVGDNSAMMWLYNAKRLAENFRLIAVDAIGGAGKSVPGPAYAKRFSQVEWISELMDSLGIGKASAAGVSYGCYIVQLLKIKIPDRIDRIIGMSGTIAVEGSKSSSARMMKVFLPEALFPNDKNVLKLLNKLTGPENDNVTGNPELMNHWKLLLKNFNNMSMSRHPLDKFSRENYLAIKDESLFLIGDKDLLSYYPGSLYHMKELFMNYEVIPAAGHAINHENPSLINKKILDFLTK